MPAGARGAPARALSRPSARVRLAAVKAFPLSDVQATLGHAHIATTMRYVHHRPGAEDAAKLAAFEGETLLVEDENVAS